MTVLEEIYRISAGTIEMMVHYWFFHRLIGKRIKKWHCAVYLAAGNAFINLWNVDVFWELMLLALLLYTEGVAGQRIRKYTALLYVIVTMETVLFSYGIVDSLLGMLSPYFYPGNPAAAGPAFMLGGEVLVMGFVYVCCRFVEGHMLLAEPEDKDQLLLALAPLLLVFIISEAVHHSVYGNVTVVDERGIMNPGINHVRILITEVFCMLTLFSVLHFCRKLTERFRLVLKVSLLEQEARYQKQYVREAQSRYDKTKAFRHDIRSHLIVMDGLLAEGKTEQARSYLKGMEAITQELSFPCRTKHPVVDILIGNKLGIAQQEGIQSDCALTLPEECAVDDMDFCVLFSNALDNALHACGRMPEGGRKYIRLSGCMQGDFLFIEIENSYDGNQEYELGTGLSNMRTVVDKYGGTMHIKGEEHRFCISVLLLISGRQKNIS